MDRTGELRGQIARAREVIRLVQDGTIKLGVEAEYDLADVGKAVTRSDQSGRAGKVLLTATA